MRLLFIGFGTVGRGLAELLVELRRQTRGGWRDDLAPPRLAAWIREGLSAEESAAERISDAAGRD